MALMRKSKLTFQRAENGLIAVQKYTASPSTFFLVLMDMSMPVMDGFRATKEIRAFEKAKGLPRCNITALTGVVSMEARKNAFASGIDKFMSKPIRMLDISNIVEETQKRSRGEVVESDDKREERRG